MVSVCFAKNKNKIMLRNVQITISSFTDTVIKFAEPNKSESIHSTNYSF